METSFTFVNILLQLGCLFFCESWLRAIIASQIKLLLYAHSVTSASEFSYVNNRICIQHEPDLASLQVTLVPAEENMSEA